MKIEMLGEFGYDLTLGAPFAYHQYINGVDFETINVKDTKPFYFFSENHIELDMKRDSNSNILSKVSKSIKFTGPPSHSD